MGRLFKPNCSWCGAPRAKGVTCKCRKAASARKMHAERYSTDPAYRAKMVSLSQLFQKNNPAIVNAKNRRWRAENQEHANAYYRDRYRNDPEKAKAAKNKWKRANPDSVRVYAHRRRTSLRNAEGHLTAKEWRAICHAQSHRCSDCKEREKLTIGHGRPLSRGGSNNASNIIAQCQPCNSRQGRKVHPKFA